jgi:tRNA pseudouridine38-40 synthase
MRNLKMIAEYDGTAYHGWQRQRGHITIQQVLEESIGAITQEDIKVIGSGRTDAGVHAANQVANFMTGSHLGERNLLLGINSMLPQDIAVKELAETDLRFHARFDAKSKIYTYQIWNESMRSPLYRHYAWHVRNFLAANRMREAAGRFIGTHDFSSFCAANCGFHNHIRTVKRLDIDRDQRGMLTIDVEADGFLKYMVRNMVGMLVDVGMGKRDPNEVTSVIEAKDRRQAAVTAPARGLFLREVRYS